MRRSSFLALCFGILLSPLALAGEKAVQPVTVPFELLPTRHMTVMIRINGKGPYRVIFDTGSPFSLLSSKVAKEAGLSAQNSGWMGIGLFGSVTSVKAKILELGGIKAKDVPFLVMDHPTIQLMSSVLGPVEGIVGFPFFARYRMTLDYQKKELTFVPTSFEPVDILQALVNGLLYQKSEPRLLSPAGLWGFSVEKDAADQSAGVKVGKVLNDSPASKAGLRPGDRLLILDDRWTDSVQDCYAAAGAIAAGTEVTLKIKRDGLEKEIRLKPVQGL